MKITLTNSPQKGLDYTGGLMSTWNKFCFRGGYVESEGLDLFPCAAVLILMPIGTFTFCATQRVSYCLVRAVSTGK